MKYFDKIIFIKSKNNLDYKDLNQKMEIKNYLIC